MHDATAPSRVPGQDPSQAPGQDVVAMARALGFAVAGVCDARASDFQDHFRSWLAEHKHGEMEWLVSHVEQRLDPRVFVPGCRWLLIVGDLYRSRHAPAPDPAAQGHAVGTDDDHAAPRIVGRVARYAQGDDYHRVIKKRLHALCDQLASAHPGHIFRAFTDTAPIFEREHAQRAGLGWIGRHTLLIHPRLGSFMLLGGIATSLELGAPGSQAVVADHCGTCTRCVDACPTGAIGDHTVDATRCISYLTIEHRSAIPPALHRLMGDWLFGCDVCQEVCPHNSPRSAQRDQPQSHPAYATKRTGFDALRVLGWSPEDRSDALRGSAIKRATLAMLRRNALIVAANALLDPSTPADARRDVLALVRSIAGDGTAAAKAEDELVRQTARDLLAHHPAFRAGASRDAPQ
jgi:epoxyqueuosine reductase